MKNKVLSFVTGMAIGCLMWGFALADAEGFHKTLSTIMFIVGGLWLVPFVIVNRKILF